MYTEYFGLQAPPFALTPDPRFLFLSPQHREALAHLLYGTGEGGGFVQLTGEVGTGKTTLCRALLRQLPPEVDVALVLSPPRGVEDLIDAICRELAVGAPEGAPLRARVEALNTRLLESHARGRRTMVLLDEAQNLSDAVLEEVRLLTNLETEETKLLQVFLVGQPELREALARPGLRQVAQRITARFHLGPMSRAETARYVAHRLSVAGCERELFTAAALGLIHRHAGGLPRGVNILCDRALLGAWAEGAPRVTRAVARRAARELEDGLRPRRWALAGVTALVAVAAGAVALWQASPPWPGATALSASPQPEATGEAPADAPPMEAEADPAGPEARLLSLWGGPAGARGEPLCVRAAAAGLRCHRTRGDWETLEQLARPALLETQGPEGRGRLLVTGIGPGGVRVEDASGTRVLSRAELDGRWTGELLTLWRPPPTGAARIHAESSLAALRWLRDSLHRLQGDPKLQEGAARYDAAVAEAVRRFQRSRGITVDGLVGPETLMHLEAALGEGMPRLAAVPAG